jgi:hypothetical protein
MAAAADVAAAIDGDREAANGPRSWHNNAGDDETEVNGAVSGSTGSWR